MFLEIKIILPNLIICDITEENLQIAFNKGITVEQILKYFSENVHPSVLARKKKMLKEQGLKAKASKFFVLPNNVIQQIAIWSDQSKK